MMSPNGRTDGMNTYPHLRHDFAAGQAQSLARASIVIPTYNRAQMLIGCLQSLIPALAAGAEVIVVDDGSTDGSPEAVARLSATLPPASAAALRVIVQPNAGPGAARNTGVAASGRDWIVFVDSDDLWLPWSAAALSDALLAAQDEVAIFFMARGFASDSPPTEFPADWPEQPQHLSRHPGFFAMRSEMKSLIGAGYFAIRRDTIAGMGGFLPKVLGGEDMDLFYRLEEAGPVMAIQAPVIVAAREDNADSLTKSMKAVAQGLGLLLSRQRAGHYRSTAARTALADALQFWLQALCNEGYGRAAYGLLLRQGGIGILLAEGRHMAVRKLLLHPLLSLVRPKNYKFGWGPRLAG